MDSSVAHQTTSQENKYLKTSDAWEDYEESELETEDESVMPNNRARPRFADMRSEGSWSAMSDKDPLKAFRQLVGSLLEASPASSPAAVVGQGGRGRHQSRDRNASAVSNPWLIPEDGHSNPRRSRGASPRLSKLLRAGLLHTPTADGGPRGSFRSQHRRDSTLQAFRQLAGSLLLQTPNGGGGSAKNSPQQGSQFKFPPRKRSFLSPRASLLEPRASFNSGRGSVRRSSRRHSTAKALRHIADALCLSPSTGTQRTSMRSTYLATPSSSAHHGRDESRELFDAIVGAIVRLKTQTPMSKISSKKGKKKLKLVWVEEDEEEDITAKIHLPTKPPAAFSQKKFSDISLWEGSEMSDDDELDSVLPIGNPSHGDEQKPSHDSPGLLGSQRSRLGSIASDDEPSVMPLKKPRLDEQKPSSGPPGMRDTSYLGSEPNMSMKRSLTPQRSFTTAVGVGGGSGRVSRKTVRVIDMNSMIERHSTGASTRSRSRLGDLCESPSVANTVKSTTIDEEDANLLLRLIDLHSKQHLISPSVGLVSERAEDIKTDDEMDDDEILVMRLSQFSAASRQSSRPPAQSLPKGGRRPLRRQHSDLGAQVRRESVRRASRRRATAPVRHNSDPNLRIRPLIDPKTNKANCSIM